LGFEDIPKFLFSPNLEALLKVLLSLLKSEHFGTLRDSRFPPPSWGLGLELWMSDPESLQSKGLAS
jgi:hypothetical protein